MSLLGLLGLTERVERGFDTETAFAATAIGGGVFGSGEGEVAEREERGRWGWGEFG